jgi:endo-1,4-beta-xylanase
MQPLAVVNTIDDWITQDPVELEANLRRAMTPGELVLMHDGGGDQWGTIEALRVVVRERLAHDWRFTLPAGA